MTERTRAEHIEWCKQRAREYLDRGDLHNAVASLVSDLNKHDDTRPSSALALLGMSAIMHGDSDDVRKFIEGFN